MSPPRRASRSRRPPSGSACAARSSPVRPVSSRRLTRLFEIGLTGIRQGIFGVIRSAAAAAWLFARRQLKSGAGMDMRVPFHRTTAARRAVFADLGKFILVASIAVWLLSTGTSGLGYPWQWYRVPRFLFSTQDGVWTAGPLIEGLLVTLEISALSLLCTLVLGLTTAFFRLSTSFTARALALSYLELIRNTPLLIQIFFVYFVLSPVLDIGAFTSAVLALSLFEGAYTAEILRAGIVSLQRGQWEAAHSLGLNIVDTYRYVILPQAVRRVLPPLTGQAISLVKDSALVSTIAIYDLTMQGQRIVAETFLAFEIWFTVAAIYLVITFSLSLAVRSMERRMTGLLPGKTGGPA